jgi:hypothetical protein
MNDRRRYTDFTRRFSQPEALPLNDPAHIRARNKACAAVLAALEEFERATGRTVSGVHLHHIDATTLDDKEQILTREVFVLWHETQAEFARRDEDI